MPRQGQRWGQAGALGFRVGGAQQPPWCLHNPANPSSCLAFPFLAKITPEHVSTLSCQESHFREAFSLSLFPPVDTNQTQLRFIGCEGRATCIWPSSAPPKNDTRVDLEGLCRLVQIVFAVPTSTICTGVLGCRTPHPLAAETLHGNQRRKSQMAP